MGFLFILSILSSVILILAVTLALAAGLFFLAEVIEEYTVLTAKILRHVIWMNIAIQIGLGIFESFPIHLLVCNLTHQVLNLGLIGVFPNLEVTSVVFLLNAATLILNHYWAFGYFGIEYYPFVEVMAYFTLCLWIVPFIFFVSLSANEYTLPTTSQTNLGETLMSSNREKPTSLLNRIKSIGFLQEKFSNYNNLKI